MATNRPSLSLSVSLRQTLTPSLVQMVTVLALNKLELKDMITQEMVANPVLEEAGEQENEPAPSADEIAEAGDQESESNAQEPEGREEFEAAEFGSSFKQYLDTGYRGPAAEVTEKPSFETFLASPATLTDHLQWQLNFSVADATIIAAAESIIGNLNEDGFLLTTLEEIAQSGGHSVEDVARALEALQEFDPPGVAARDMQECLLIQLRLIGMDRGCAGQIVRDHLNLLQKKDYREIGRLLQRPISEVDKAVALIRQLDPRPGQRYNNSEPCLIEPDVSLVKVEGEYQVRLNDDDVPELRLNSGYRRLLDRTAAKDVRAYVKERYNSAMQLIRNIEQRKHTIVRVCLAIAGRQRDFLDHGIDSLKPMMIKDVAEEIGVHASTVSRAVRNKYVNTPQGVFELRYFFSEAVNGPAGGDTSLLLLKRNVKKIIEAEDPMHPLTDENLTRILRSRGIAVTRRTVAKYREDMKIPSTHQRRRRS